MTVVPANHALHPSGRRAFLHPSLRNLESLGLVAFGSTVASIVLGFLVLMFLAENSHAQMSETEAVRAWLIPFLASWIPSVLIAMRIETDRQDVAAMIGFRLVAKEYASLALKRTMMHGHDKKLHAILKDEHAHREPVRLMLARIADANLAYARARARFGTADTGPAEAVYAEAVASIVDETHAEIRTIREEIESRDRIAAVDALEDLSLELQDSRRLRPDARTGRALKASTPLSVARLVAAGEKALVLDPDLVDSGGSRIDGLVRDHLPRLLARYADLTMVPGGSAEADRAMLDQGLSMCARSIDEGLRTIRNAKADALRTEIAFLSARRGEPVPALAERQTA